MHLVSVMNISIPGWPNRNSPPDPPFGYLANHSKKLMVKNIGYDSTRSFVRRLSIRRKRPVGGEGEGSPTPFLSPGLPHPPDPYPYDPPDPSPQEILPPSPPPPGPSVPRPYNPRTPPSPAGMCPHHLRELREAGVGGGRRATPGCDGGRPGKARGGTHPGTGRGQTTAARGGEGGTLLFNARPDL